MGYEVDPGALQGISKTLRSGSQSIENVSSSMPESVDAGEFTGVISELVSVFASAAGEVSTGLMAAAEAVDDNGRVYQDTDDTAAQDLQAHSNQ